MRALVIAVAGRRLVPGVVEPHFRRTLVAGALRQAQVAAALVHEPRRRLSARRLLRRSGLWRQPASYDRLDFARASQGSTS